MSSVILKTLRNLEKHNVGSLNQWTKELLNQGAKVAGADMDNYCLGTLGFNAAGERTVTALASNTVKGVLVASVEDYTEYEGISQFFNEVGEMARIVYQSQGRHFEASNFEKADDAKAIAVGQKAHYDATKKKFVVSNGTADHTDYSAAANKYLVVAVPSYTLGGQSVIRFEIA